MRRLTTVCLLALLALALAAPSLALAPPAKSGKAAPAATTTSKKPAKKASKKAKKKAPHRWSAADQKTFLSACAKSKYGVPQCTCALRMLEARYKTFAQFYALPPAKRTVLTRVLDACGP